MDHLALYGFSAHFHQITWYSVVMRPCTTSDCLVLNASRQQSVAVQIAWNSIACALGAVQITWHSVDLALWEPRSLALGPGRWNR
jgi:hypothetical protein